MGVQEQACLALAKLAMNAENLAALVDEGAHTSVIRAMEAHQDSVEVQEQAKEVLRFLDQDWLAEVTFGIRVS